MADAAPTGGGNGWGALEVILAIILAIGLIATLTGNPIVSITGPSKSSSGQHTTGGSVSSITGSGCGIIVSLPTSGEKIYNTVTVKGVVAQCINVTSIPDTVNVYVIDSANTVLSAYTTISVNKSFFGNPNFSAVIPLQGTAYSTTAYVVINAPATGNSPAFSTRIRIYLQPGTTF